MSHLFQTKRKITTFKLNSFRNFRLNNFWGNCNSKLMVMQNKNNKRGLVYKLTLRMNNFYVIILMLQEILLIEKSFKYSNNTNVIN